MKAAAFVADWPSGFATVTDTAPAARAGVRATSVVAVCDSSVPVVPPNVTTAPAWKPVPVIVTSVPPAVVPVAGDTVPIVGGGGGGGAAITACTSFEYTLSRPAVLNARTAKYQVPGVSVVISWVSTSDASVADSV